MGFLVKLLRNLFVCESLRCGHKHDCDKDRSYCREVYRDRSCLCVLLCETSKVKTRGDISMQPDWIYEIMETSRPCGKRFATA
jgi:hypothetical protein